jgi:CubicO group peptidase (beta-lactamase class C family)
LGEDPKGGGLKPWSHEDMKKHLVLASLIFVCACLGARVGLAESPDVARMERAIDLKVGTGQFMGAVLVARESQVVINKAYGLANVPLRIANQPDTRFRIGSATKQFTAAAILLLGEQGKLKIDDPIKKYLPDAPAAWDGITFYHLLTHTSGIPNLTSLPDYRAIEGASATPAQLVARFRDLPLDFQPGTSWNYSNSGYVLLGYLIEKISGTPYGRFVHQRFFAPLRMWSSGYQAGSARLPGQALGYSRSPGGPVAARAIDMSVPYSAAGIYSTSGDLLKWVHALYGGKLLKPASLEKMITPFKNHYALGLTVELRPDGSKVLTGGGGIEGFNARVVYDTRSKLTLIVLANLSGDAADELVADLRRVAEGTAATLMSDRSAVMLSAEALERLTGYYWTDKGTIITVSRKNDHLEAQGVEGHTRELYPQSRREFYAKTEDVEASFSDDARGRIESLWFRLPDRQLHAGRIGAEEAREMYAERERKIRDQTATPGSDAAVRELLEGIAAGDPDYSSMGAALGELMREQLSRLQPVLERLGAIQHTDFVGVAPGTGADVYLVTFERGAMEMRICLGPDGKIWSQELRPWQ